jgi:hypothetical protein
MNMDINPATIDANHTRTTKDLDLTALVEALCEAGAWDLARSLARQMDDPPA